MVYAITIMVILAARLVIDYLADKHTGAHLARPWMN